MISQYENFIKIILPLILCLSSSNVYAVRWTGEGGFHTGGDTLANALNSNGNNEKIKAGDLLTFGIGPHFDLTDNTHLRTLFGVKMDSVNSFTDEATIDSSTDNISFTRFPLDVMYFYQTRNWNFGGGLSYHIHPKLAGNAVYTNYKNALGYALEVDFRLGEFFYLGGKYTSINYKAENSNEKIDGNSVGVVMGFIFGDKH